MILEEINALGGQRRRLPRADVHRWARSCDTAARSRRTRYLPRIASGELRLQAFGVTEPTAGSDTPTIETTAERVDGGYVVRGQKIWTSRAEHSDLMLLLARTTPLDEVQKRGEGLSMFLLDMRDCRRRG